MRKHVYLSLGMAASLFTAHSVHAAVVVAVEDNYVHSGQSTTPQDSDGNLLVKNATQNIRKTWLKFDLTGQNVDYTKPGTITLTLAENTHSQTSFTLELFGLHTGVTGATTWSEETITWSNAPGNVTSGGNAAINSQISADNTSLGNTGTIASSTAAGTSYQFQISDLSTFLQSDHTITAIAISNEQSSAGPDFDLASSENETVAWRPTLTFSTIPEPSATTLLFGLTGFITVVLGSSRRR